MSAARIPAALKKHLWDHQVEALGMVSGYLREFSRGRASGAALVRFPTGTGKTGVIATAARALAPAGIVVVTCPSVALRKQLFTEIGERFWEKLNVGMPRPRTDVLEFTPEKLVAAEGILEANRLILVGTVQALAAIHHRMPDLFDVLQQRTHLVLFDEGHREPAPQWAEAVRALMAPTVLFSATPYRNDYARFAINTDHVTSLSFSDALKNSLVRNVETRKVLFTDPGTFADQLCGCLAERDDEERAIVRCATHASIVDVVKALQARGISAIGIHERFGSKKAALRKAVPDPHTEDARVWVHQYKLLEGIDDPRFTIVAVYEQLGNARALVQQVGRVIRNPNRLNLPPAILLTHKQHAQAGYWSSYLDFEDHYDPVDHDIRAQLKDDMLRQPPRRYLDGKYRAAFDPFADDFWKHLRLPRSSNILTLFGTWSPERIQTGLTEEWEDNDRLILNSAVLDNTTVLLYAVAVNSPTLRSDYFLEVRLGFTVTHRDGEFLFYYDSSGASSETVKAMARPVSPPQMHALFGRDSRPVAMSMLNTDVSQAAFRRRTVQAYSLAEVSVGLGDHGYFCSTAEGYDQPTGESTALRRYVGMTRGRLRESSPQDHGLEDFISWAAKKSSALRESHRAPEIFDRFAAHVDPPPDPTPAHILLDVSDILAEGSYTSPAGEALDMDDLAAPVRDGCFSVTANGHEYDVRISYDEARHTYRLTCDELDLAFQVRRSDRQRRGLVSHLNLTQAFRIALKDSWVMYAHGHFVQPATGVGRSAKNGLNLLHLFRRTPALANATSEKGDAAAPTAGWSADSVFGIIDRCKSGADGREGADELIGSMADLNILVCDDMGKERADFIGASTHRPQIVLVHAKYKEARKSATALQDVCAQAVKNLGFLQPFSRPYGGYAVWDGNWRLNTAEVPRIRLGDRNAKWNWDRMQELLRRPDTRRSVWLVLGKTLDVDWLSEERRKHKPAPEAVQLFYLLESTWSAVSSVGAQLLIFAG